MVIWVGLIDWMRMPLRFWIGVCGVCNYGWLFVAWICGFCWVYFVVVVRVDVVI